MSDKPKSNKLFPASHWGCLVIVILCFCVGSFQSGTEVVKDVGPATNPDPRPTEEIVWYMLHYTCRKDPDCKTVTQGNMKRTARQADKQLELMQFVPGKRPEMPEPPKMEGDGIKAKIRFKVAERSYEQAVKTLKRRQQLWDENQKTRDKYIFVAGIKHPKGVGPSKEESQKGAMKFLRFDNLFGYVAEWQYLAIVNQLYQRLYVTDGAYDYPLGWLKKGFEEFKKSKGLPGKRESWKKDKEPFREYVTEALLRQPLTRVKLADGSYAKVWYGLTVDEAAALNKAKEDGDEETVKKLMAKADDCWLLKPYAEMVTRANARMFKAIKEEIMPMVCYRNNAHQAALLVTIVGPTLVRPKKKGKSRFKFWEKTPAVTFPGVSLHGFGLAMDLANSGRAMNYLAAEAGTDCDHVKNDKGHCSLGEMHLTKRSVKRHKKRHFKADKKDVKNWKDKKWKEAKDWWYNRKK